MLPVVLTEDRVLTTLQQQHAPLGHIPLVMLLDLSPVVMQMSW